MKRLKQIGDDNVELQVRITYETAEMLELLKEYYKDKEGINFTKGEVLSKAILDTYDDWKEIDWQQTLRLPITIEKEYAINAGAQRPKFQLSNNVAAKMETLRTIIKQSVDARSVTIGAAIKFVLRQTIYEIQHGNTISVEQVINDTLERYLSDDLSSDTKNILQKYADELLTKLEINDLL